MAGMSSVKKNPTKKGLPFSVVRCQENKKAESNGL